MIKRANVYLQYGSVSHLGGGHERQDALGGAADERRWPVRDGRGRLGPQARAPAAGGELPAVWLNLAYFI